MKTKLIFAACLILALSMILVSCGIKIKPEAEDEAAEQAETSETEENEEEPVQQEVTEAPVVIPAEDPEASVYLIIPTQEGQSAIEAEAIEREVKAAGIPLIVKCYNRNVEKQTEAFEEAIRENASLIICDNGDVEYTTLEAEKAKDSHIPVILLNRGIDSMGIASSQIITDTYSCVRELGEEFVERTGGSIDYIEVQGSNSSFDITEAFADVMSEHEEMFMVRSDIADENDPDESYDVIWNMINESPEADAVVCYNVMQTKTAMEAAGDLGRSMIFVCLYGDDDSITEMVESGRVFAAVIKPGEDLAENAAEQVKKYINTGELPSSELVYVKGNIIKYEGSPDDEDEEGSSEEAENEEQQETPSEESEETDGEYVEVEEYEPAGEGLPE